MTFFPMYQGPQVDPAAAPTGPTGLTDLREQNIRGVLKLKPRLDRPSPFGVRWTSAAGRKKEFFKTEKPRDDRYADLVKKAKRGTLREEMSREDKLAWGAFRAAIGDTPWQDVVTGWREHLRSTGRSACTKTVAEAGQIYLAAMAARQANPQTATSSGYYAHLKQKTQLFVDAFGASKLDAVAGPDIEAWIDELGSPANATFNNYLKFVRLMFEHFRKEVENPCDEIDARSEEIDTVAILTVQQTAKLFAYAHQHHKDALGRLALEAFCGLRFSSAFRLEKSDINFEDRGITLPAHKHKVGRRFYIDGLPDNVWSWLQATNDGCWAMRGSEWMHFKSRLFVDADVPHPRNCLRHSFCTYHVAAFKNPGLTATILTHRNQQKLWSNYNGRATQANGKLYFTITPDSAASIAVLKVA